MGALKKSELSHQHHRVITHKEALAYFNHDVQPETVLRYIKAEGLPAVQRGRLYFIEAEALFNWQLRRGSEDWKKSPLSFCVSREARGTETFTYTVA